jgi:hypothetical protein
MEIYFWLYGLDSAEREEVRVSGSNCRGNPLLVLLEILFELSMGSFLRERTQALIDLRAALHHTDLWKNLTASMGDIMECGARSARRAEALVWPS